MARRNVDANIQRGYGKLQFYKDGVSIPASYKHPAGTLWLNFDGHKFRDIIETLRLEKPLYIRFDDTNSTGFISTSAEPVGGEEE